MKRSKAFVLVELLTGMLLQAGFVVVLCTSFYLMFSFYTRTQQVLNARQKGEKVIAYVEARIRDVGLGLQECHSSGEIRGALNNMSAITLAHTSGQKHYLTLPVAVTSGDTSQFSNTSIYISKVYEDENNKDILRGNILTLLYTKRPLNLNTTIRTSEDKQVEVKGVNISVDICNNNHKMRLVVPSALSDFGTDTTGSYNNLDSYTVLPCTGVPVFIYKDTNDNNNGRFELRYTGNQLSNVYVYPGDELLYLKCERMFVQGNNFRFWNFSGNIWDTSKLHSNEEGILEVYFELDRANNILDMYVLASGGNNDSRNTKRPSSWPSDFWKSEYENYTIYMSRASWKIHNLPRNFEWDYL